MLIVRLISRLFEKGVLAVLHLTTASYAPMLCCRFSKFQLGPFLFGLFPKEFTVIIQVMNGKSISFPIVPSFSVYRAYNLYYSQRYLLS